MNRLNNLVYVALVCTLALATTASAQGRPRRVRPDAHFKPSGGIVEKPYAGNFFRIVNAQRTVTHERVRRFALAMRMETLLAFEAREGKSATIDEARQMAIELLKESRTGAIVVIVDDPSREAYIESAESRWAILNLAPLKADQPDSAKLEERCGKMMWRASARALGVGYSNHDVSVLMPFSSLAELDANRAVKPAPDGVNALMTNAAGYGMTPLTIASYRTACRNGWAPSPTNDVQRKIWNEIHQIPDKPITIEYDPKRDK